MKKGIGSEHTAQETGVRNMVVALQLAQRLGGWVTPDLVARHVWPQAKPKASRKTTSDLLRRAVDRRWLLARPLGGRRLLYVVTAGGARWLADTDYGNPSLTGTDLGKLEAGKWSPPATLAHDLRAARWLVHLAAKGWVFVTGWELARLNPQVRKLPDGLASKDGTLWYWIEAEGARKSGPKMARLAEELIAVRHGHGPWLRIGELGDPVQPRATMVLLPPPVSGVNHRLRIESAVRRQHPLEPVRLRFFTEVQPWAWEEAQATVGASDDAP